MPEKPRQKLRPGQRPKINHELQRRLEYRNCDAPNCPNVIASWAIPPGYSGRIYCVLHRDGKKTR